jgi:hypothetical protein
VTLDETNLFYLSTKGSAVLSTMNWPFKVTCDEQSEVRVRGERSAATRPGCRVQDKGPSKVQRARTSGPFLRFSESYCFGTGSVPKFAWTNTHLSAFFT